MTSDLPGELFELPLEERLELVQEIWDSVAAECERSAQPLTTEQREDLVRHLAEAESPRVGTIGTRAVSGAPPGLRGPPDGTGAATPRAGRG